MMGGLGGMVVQGMAFGTGSAIAHRAMDGVMGPRTVQHEYVDSDNNNAGGEERFGDDDNRFGSSGMGAGMGAGAAAAGYMADDDDFQYRETDPCSMQKDTFMQCVQQQNARSDDCRFYMKAWQQCEMDTQALFSEQSQL